MSRSIKLNKGFDIRLEGTAEKKLAGAVNPEMFGVKPIDFPGLIPKLDVRPGDEVQAGTPLFYDKLRPEIKFTSPVSGKVISVERGDRRKILEVVVAKSGNGSVDFGKSDPEKLSGEQIKELMLKSGLWPSVRQRPYHIVANPSDLPKSIFISGFDTAPLAPDLNFILKNSSVSFFRTGLKTIAKLTNGNVNLVLRRNETDNTVFDNVAGVEKSYFFRAPSCRECRSAYPSSRSCKQR